MRSFQASIEQMLWPEKREKDELLGDKIPGKMDRTTKPSYLRVSSGYLPEFLTKLPVEQLLPKLFDDDGIQIGPIPSGTPVGLLANLDPLSETRDLTEIARHQAKVKDLLLKMAKDLAQLPAGYTEEQAREKFRNLVEPLLSLSKCPDFVVNRGHLFGTTLPDPDKRALIEFLKTF
jgi:hypothetical protein